MDFKMSKKLKEIEEREKKATPGPWELDVPMVKEWGVTAKGIISAKGDDVIHADDFYLDAKERDFDFILNARTDILWLLNRLQTALISLEFYANRDNWDDDLYCPTIWDDGGIDLGRQAQKALRAMHEE